MPPTIPRYSSRLFQLFFLAMVIFSLYLAYLLAQPFLHAIIMGIVFAALSWPLQKRMLHLTKARHLPAALMTMGILMVCIVLPAVIFIVLLIPQALASLGAISEWIVSFNIESALDSTLVTNLFALLKEHVPFINPEADDINTAILQVTKSASQFLLQGATTIVSNAVTFALHFALLLLVMFFMLLDGEAMLDRFMYLFPLKELQKDTIVERLRAVSRAVLVGGVLVSLLQGLVGGIGMAIVGMPALFCGALMAVASFVPVLGTGLVWVPVTIWLFINGMTWQGIFVLVWCGVLVTTIDSIMRPLFMSTQAGLSTFFLFMSIIGGLKVFGMLGIVYGPLVLGFVVVMLSLYAAEYHEFLSNRWAPLPAIRGGLAEKMPAGASSNVGHSASKPDSFQASSASQASAGSAPFATSAASSAAASAVASGNASSNVSNDVSPSAESKALNSKRSD